MVIKKKYIKEFEFQNGALSLMVKILNVYCIVLTFMLDLKKKYSESKCKFGFMMPKLLILFKNKKKIPWNPCIHTMKQKSFYLLKSAVPWQA